MHADNGQKNDRTVDAQVVPFLAVSAIPVSSVVECSGCLPGVTTRSAEAVSRPSAPAGYIKLSNGASHLKQCWTGAPAISLA